MKKHTLLLLLGLSTASVFAQAPAAQPGRPQQQQTAAPRGNAKISGLVLDAETKKPIEFATVALINLSTGKPIDGTMADEKGRFTISKVAAGNYKLNVSFLGYQLQAIENVSVTSDNAELNVGTVTLAFDTKKLNEVVITGEKPLIEEKIDRTVYNAEKDITNAGGNAADVLQKVPSLSLDTDGNVQLRGSANVRVLINNKPSAIMAGSVADALKQIPADMIKSVEVITSPSAKYDAEGTAGIINIITKKEGGGLQGVSGSVSATGGTRASNGNASLNVRRGKLGINASASTMQFYNKGDMTNITRFKDPVAIQRVREQHGDTDIRGGFMNGQVGFDYEITPQNSLSGSVRRSQGEFKIGNDQQQRFTIGGVEDLAQSFNTDIRNRNKRQATDFNLDFTHTFKKPGQELALLSQYATTDTDTRNNQDRSQKGEKPFFLQRNDNKGGNDELTFQADYVHPFANKTMLELGAKSIFRDVSSDGLSRDIFANKEESEQVNFVYDQDVFASYFTYGFAIKKKLNVKLGARAEQTEITGDYQQTDAAGKKVTANVTDSYRNLIPSVALAYTLKEKHTLKANFTQRIQRPSLHFLNPFDQEQAPGTVVRGNPYLDAELTDLYELGYSSFFGTSSVNATAYMRQTDNAIETVTRTEGANTVLSFANVAVNKTYGMSLFGSVKPVKAWTLGGSSNIYYVKLKSDKYTNDGWMYNINLNSSYDFGKGISAQFNGGFNSRRVQLQGKFNAFSFHTLAFKKELFAGKGGLSVGLDNPFRKSMKMNNDVNAVDFEQRIRINNYNRGARVTFDYRFGKMEKAKPRRKRSIRNDDAKQGDGNGGIQ